MSKWFYIGKKMVWTRQQFAKTRRRQSFFFTAKNHTHITYGKPVTATALENNTQLQQDQRPMHY